MVDSSSEELVAAYLTDREWDEQRAPVEKTAGIVQDLAAALLEAGELGQQEVTALYRLCMNNSTYPVSSKRDEIDEVDIPEDVKRDLKERVTEEVGTVGGLLFPIEIPAEDTEAVTACFETLVTSDEPESWDDAVRQLAELDLPNVKCGKLSPILSYLHPEYYPVVNTMSRTGLAEYFDEDVSNAVSEFPETAATYRSVRDEYGFEANFRDLDYFFVWANNREKERGGVTLEGERSYFWVNQSNQSEIEDEYLRAKVDDVWHHDLAELTDGDVVFHNFNDELIGLSTVTGAPTRYEFRGDEYHRVPVEFEWFAESVPVDSGLKDSLDTPEWHQKYYPIDSNGNLKQAYLSRLSLPAAEFLLDTAEAWNLLQSSKPGGTGEEIPDAPDQAGEIERQLLEKKQVVFYGPPGTGKTYTAERFAKWWVGQQDGGDAVSDRVATVTFHPSFTYEDFVEGLSAKTGDDGQVAYEVQDGALKRMQAAAMAAYERAVEADTEPDRYVLIIDEINRGNLAQIFGEVITLLEADKRGSFDVELAHSGETFTLPPNLYVIGTMNTADQSIALVDTALRRRFRFVDFPPDLDVVWEESDVVAADARSAVTQPNEDVSRRDQLLGASVLAVETLNERILRAPELGKGKQLGHTYLLGHDSTTDVVDAWRYDILPQLEEYYFGQFDRLRDDLLTETGDRLVQWDAEKIKSFDANALYTALCQLAGIDDPVPLAAAPVEAIADGTGVPRGIEAWRESDKSVEAFRELITSTLDETAHTRADRLLTAGEEIGRLDTGGGDHNVTAQLKTDLIDPGVGLIQINQDGKLKFRLNWLAGRDENELTAEFVDEAASVFDEIDAYSYERRPDPGDDEKEFTVSNIQIADLSEDEMDVLVDGYKKFAQRAEEFQDG
ncbi:AAA family ATPase [Halomicroarcula sp. S1AR25-4]|uniref:McrB family protein n=1 Tax=Haloarcula sp. S1AR25-4 TaxID=2950538 RepID=UPI0028759C6A|nr:AAA family ATPase [Halomicroarcula sp. S1AR25-4]MDS0276566.1 AAA family ATPase [Halomicroarcula sp. S1AR25-4]